MNHPNYSLLVGLSEGSDRHVGPHLGKMLLDLVPSAVELLADVETGRDRVAEVRAGLHRALDFAAHGALASSFVMQVMRIEWERLGGTDDDPAPWRNEPPFSV